MGKLYNRQDLTGGGTGALDNLNGALLSDGDRCLVVFPADHATYPSQFMVFTLDANSAAAESSPTIIVPDTNASDKRWIRCAFGFLPLPAAAGTEAQILIVDDAAGLAYKTVSGAISIDKDGLVTFTHVNATVKTGSFTGFTGSETKEVDITGISSNNPVVRKAQLYISNDPAADENINFRLGFYNSDSKTEDELITAFYFNLTYTESNGGASATDTTDTVDDISGLVLHDLIRYMEGTAENVRLSATPSGTTLTFTALTENHANDGGIVKVVEITSMFQLFDADSSNEIHAKLETFSSPNASMNVAISLEVQ